VPSLSICLSEGILSIDSLISPDVIMEQVYRSSKHSPFHIFILFRSANKKQSPEEANFIRLNKNGIIDFKSKENFGVSNDYLEVEHPFQSVYFMI
jgi:hypothetical protein